MTTTGLTERELEVLKLKAAGLQYKEIARKLDIAPTTVHVHTATILKKLAVCNSTAAVVVAIRDGDIDPDEIDIARR